MGTSSAFGGQGTGTPLVPSWLGNGDAPAAVPPGAPAAPSPQAPPPTPPPPIPPAGAPDRFTSARSNFSRFVTSGGDRRSLGRALSGYVRSSAGGARTAAQRMGASRSAGSRLVAFLSNVNSVGVAEALRSLNLGALVGRSIEDVFTGLVDFICPAGGSIDQGIARDAFVETITQLAEAGVTDLNALTPDQITTVFELYATNAIEARICNDIGNKVIVLPATVGAVGDIQAQLRDFIQRAVSDALAAAGAISNALPPDQVLGFVDGVYEQAFNILRSIAEAAAEET